jgi:hypothetical protein
MLTVTLVTLGALAVFLIPVAIAHYRRERLLRERGTRATGRILELGESTDGMGAVSGHWAKVGYTRYEQPSISVVTVRRGFAGYRVGQRVDVTYVPGRRLVRLDS